MMVVILISLGDSTYPQGQLNPLGVEVESSRDLVMGVWSLLQLSHILLHGKQAVKGGREGGIEGEKGWKGER